MDEGELVSDVYDVGAFGMPDNSVYILGRFSSVASIL